MNILLKFVTKGPINNIGSNEKKALVPMMDWCCLGNKPFSEPMLA